MTLRVTLPYPPSVNSLFRNAPRKGRVKTQRYLSWRRAAGNELLAQKPSLSEPRIAGPVVAEITVGRRDARSDIDNLAKAILDLLVEHDMIDDDRRVERVTIQWGEVEGAVVEITRYDPAYRKQAAQERAQRREMMRV